MMRILALRIHIAFIRLKICPMSKIHQPSHRTGIIIVHTSDENQLFHLGLQYLGEMLEEDQSGKDHGMIGKPFRIKSKDKPTLLLDFLSFALRESITENVVFNKLVIEFLSTQYLDGTLYGKPSEKPLTAIESINYPESSIHQNPDLSWDLTIRVN
ncbi:MAG TPA: hypothetical protein PK643_04825 [Saprospiraceae bacterium]|nr:hypothetical protein [Saprospiraceae bacterium]